MWPTRSMSSSTPMTVPSRSTGMWRTPRCVISSRARNRNASWSMVTAGNEATCSIGASNGRRADEGGPGEIRVGHDALRVVGAADQRGWWPFSVHPQRGRLHRRGCGDDDRRMQEGLPDLRHHQRRHPARRLARHPGGETLAEPLCEPGFEGRVGTAEIEQQAARQQLRDGLLPNLRGRRRGRGERLAPTRSPAPWTVITSPPACSLTSPFTIR